MDNFDLRKYLSEGKLLKESLGSDPKYYVKYTTLDGKEVKSELMSKREAIYKERDLVDSGVKKSSVYKFTKNIDLNGKPYVIDLELDKEIDYRKDEKGRPIDEGKLLKEEIKFIDYLTVDQDEFKALYDKHYDDDGHMEDFEEDFIRDFGVDFLSPNIEKIEKYYGYKVSKEDVLDDFFIGDGLEFISSNERFEKWLDRSREFFIL